MRYEKIKNNSQESLVNQIWSYRNYITSFTLFFVLAINHRTVMTVGKTLINPDSESLTRTLSEPAVVSTFVQVSVPAAVNTWSTFSLNRERLQEERNQRHIQNVLNQIRTSEVELAQADKSNDYHTMSTLALSLFHLYLDIYKQQPTEAIEKKLNELRYTRALALAHMGKYQIDETRENTSNDEESAFSILELTLKDDPQNIDALNLRGFLFLEIYEPEKAFQDFKRSLELYPNQELIYLLKLYTEIELLEAGEDISGKLGVKENKQKEFIVLNSLFPSGQNIFSPRLAQIYAELYLEMNNFEAAVMYCEIGIACCKEDPVLNQKKHFFYEKIITAYENLLKKFEQVQDAKKVDKVIIPPMTDGQKPEILTKNEIEQRCIEYHNRCLVMAAHSFSFRKK